MDHVVLVVRLKNMEVGDLFSITKNTSISPRHNQRTVVLLTKSKEPIIIATSAGDLQTGQTIIFSVSGLMALLDHHRPMALRSRGTRAVPMTSRLSRYLSAGKQDSDLMKNRKKLSGLRRISGDRF